MSPFLAPGILLDVNVILRDVLMMVDADLPAQRVSVSAELREGLPKVLADGVRLQQVFLNLIINAMEAMGSVTDRACLLRIRLEIHDAPGILLTVEGSGTGIDPKDLDRIFDTFIANQVYRNRNATFHLRSIIEFHDGRLWAPPGVTRGRSFMSFCQKARRGRAS
jgi:light-regulated signal transduction histidine kinase (bacteriophytochrome)